MTIKKVGIYITIVGLLMIVLNIKVSTKQGVNYNVLIYKIPLYIKIIEFIDRDYRYRELSKRIIKEKRTDKDKALAVLKWTQSNIKKDFPPHWSIYDDHILNIIIRGYGASDQLSDVFTTLCMYSGLPAGWARVEVPKRREGLILSFVRINGKWHAFDVFNNRSDLIDENYFKEIEWEQYISDITLRTRKQMPFKRIIYEIKSLLKHEGTEENE